jgi:hypothetical protein
MHDLNEKELTSNSPSLGRNPMALIPLPKIISPFGFAA